MITTRNHYYLTNQRMMTARIRTLQAGRFMAAITGMLLTCANANAQLAPPIILKVSDGVAAGRSFSINGEGFYPTAMDVAIAPDTTGQSPVSPPTNAIHPAIIQTDKDAHFIICLLYTSPSPRD